MKASSGLPRREFLRGLAIAGGIAVSGRLVPVSAGQSDNSATAFRCAISVNTDAVLHKIDAKIYGTFIEHIGRGVYGGIYEDGSPLSDKDGFRTDVLNAGRAWGIPVFRWPGGNFASGYHWMDGIGPKNQRPRRYNAAWFEEESNQFGTHECIEYCRKLGADPYFCANLGTGTSEEAANWVEYCNGTGDTHYANLRRKYGSEQPFNVKYWGLGNEVYGQWQIGYKDAEDYAKLALETAKLMKWVDPEIRLVACGDDPEWNRIVLEKLIHIVDYISIHDYEGTPEYYETLGSVKHLEKRIRETQDMIDLTDPLREKGDPILQMSLPLKKERVQIAVDEWNIWYRKHDLWRRDVPNPVEEIYNLRDALWVASVLNLFQRSGKAVTMANLAQMVNVLAPILTTKTGLVLQPTYFPMKLYSQECGSRYIRSDLESPVFSTKNYGEVPYIDVSSTLAENNEFLSLAVVNRHETQPANASISIAGRKFSKKTTVFEIVAPPDAENTVSSPDRVKTVRREVSLGTGIVSYAFPAHSITLIKFS